APPTPRGGQGLAVCVLTFHRARASGPRDRLRSILAILFRKVADGHQRGDDGGSGRPGRRAGRPLPAHPHRLGPPVLPGSQLERDPLAGIQGTQSRPFDVAVVHEEVAVHRLALDEPPAVFEPRDDPGEAAPPFNARTLARPVARSLL